VKNKKNTDLTVILNNFHINIVSLNHSTTNTVEHAVPCAFELYDLYDMDRTHFAADLWSVLAVICESFYYS